MVAQSMSCWSLNAWANDVFELPTVQILLEQVWKIFMYVALSRISVQTQSRVLARNSCSRQSQVGGTYQQQTCHKNETTICTLFDRIRYVIKLLLLFTSSLQITILFNHRIKILYYKRVYICVTQIGGYERGTHFSNFYY